MKRLSLVAQASMAVLAATSAAAAAADQPTSAAAASPAPGTTLEAIVVTAEKRTENLQDVPASVSTTSGEAMATAGITSTRGLALVTPGLIYSQSAYAAQPIIRGVYSRVSLAGDEASVPLYIDGVYQPWSISFSDLYNIDRIEVLKGPQGALFGHNAIAGAINILTLDPTSTPHASLEVGYGSYNQHVVQGYVSGGTDHLSANFAVGLDGDTGYVKDLAFGGDIGREYSQSYRTKIRWTPSDKFEVKLTGSHYESHDNTGLAQQPVGDNSVAVPPGFTLPPLESDLSFVPDARLRQSSLALDAEYHQGTFDVISITGWGYTKFHVTADTDAGPADIGSLDANQFDHAVTEEIRAQSSGGGPFHWMAGAFLFFDSAGWDPLKVNHTIVVDYYARVRTQSYAGFADLSYDFGKEWTLDVSGRYTYEPKQFFGLLAPGVIGVNSSTSFSNFSPTASLRYRPVEGWEFYGRFSEGFKSGVFNSASYDPVPVQPTTAYSGELGAKIDITPRIRLNSDIYYTYYKNLQIQARNPVTDVNEIQNAASARSYGIEVELDARPIDALNLRASLSELNAKFISFPNDVAYLPLPGGQGNYVAIEDASGKTLPRAPSTTATLGADYTIAAGDGKVVISADAVYQGLIYWDEINRLKSNPYTLLNSRISWRLPGNHVRVEVWGDNLLNEIYQTTEISATYGDSQTYGRPRTFGVTLRFDY